MVMKKLNTQQLEAILERDRLMGLRHKAGISLEKFHELTVKIGDINKALGIK